MSIPLPASVRVARLAAGLLAAAAPPLCWGCGAPAARGSPLCRACRGALRHLGGEPVRLAGVETWAPLAYEGPARDLVRALKFRGAAGLADAMAAPIAARAPERLLEGATLVPVPLPPDRLRRRGFNQAALLARALAARSGLAVSDCLERRKAPPQWRRPREERLVALRGGVRLRSGRAPPARALLVDDVVTTGATLAACAAALSAPGAAAVAYARTTGR
ncbi:MAG: ComF family protein [Nocardioidaceae bacterium]